MENKTNKKLEEMVEQTKEITTEDIVKLKVRSRELTNRKQGNKFLAHTTFLKDGKRINLKFRKEVKLIPETEGTSYIFVKLGNMNISNSKEYPELWVQKVEEITTQERNEEEQVNKLTEMFDVYEGDLPF